MNRRTFSVALVVGAVLTGCVQAQLSASPLVVNVQRNGDGCYVTVNGAQVTSEALLEAAKKKRGSGGIVVFDGQAPYKCVGASIVILQEAGIGKIALAPWLGR